MKQTNLKKAIWAALLTAAFTLSATGCGEQSDTSIGAADSNAAVQTTVDNNAALNSEAATEAGTFGYAMNEDGTISITSYSGSDAALNIPATVDGYVVSAIGDHAFEANWNITSITMPNGLSVIGESAFMDCGSLNTVSIPETVSTVRRAAFAGCSALTEVTLPETVSVVMEEAFTGCGSLTSLTVKNASLEYDRWGLVENAEPLNVTISCPSGASIEAWAAENGIATQPLA